MRQPKYKFGDKFTKNLRVNAEGKNHTVSVTHVVVEIRAVATDSDFEYTYKLGSNFPQAYYSIEWTSEYILESKLTEVYTYVEDRSET